MNHDLFSKYNKHLTCYQDQLGKICIVLIYFEFSSSMCLECDKASFTLASFCTLPDTQIVSFPKKQPVTKNALDGVLQTLISKLPPTTTTTGGLFDATQNVIDLGEITASQRKNVPEIAFKLVHRFRGPGLKQSYPELHQTLTLVFLQAKRMSLLVQWGSIEEKALKEKKIQECSDICLENQFISTKFPIEVISNIASHVSYFPLEKELKTDKDIMCALDAIVDCKTRKDLQKTRTTTLAKFPMLCSTLSLFELFCDIIVQSGKAPVPKEEEEAIELLWFCLTKRFVQKQKSITFFSCDDESGYLLMCPLIPAGCKKCGKIENVQLCPKCKWVSYCAECQDIHSDITCRITRGECKLNMAVAYVIANKLLKEHLTSQKQQDIANVDKSNRKRVRRSIANSKSNVKTRLRHEIEKRQTRLETLKETKSFYLGDESELMKVD